MLAGRLRHRVVIETVSRALDAMSQGIETWTTYDTVWAEVQPLKGQQLFEAQKANSAITAKIIMRYRSGVSPTWHIKHGSQYYYIIEIINSGMRNKMLELIVTERPQSST